jgi:phosphopantetheinyl transferase
VITVVSIREVWSERDRFVRSLAASERATYDGLGIEKRCQDWLGGRIAAKRAVQKRHGWPFARIEIRVEENGRPRCGELYLSITHSGDVAAAIVSSKPIGLDVERIEPRDPSFEELVLTNEDRVLLDGLQGSLRDERLTALWCAKEAYTKLEGSGLRIPFADLVVPTSVRTETGRFDLGGTSFAFAIAR